MRSLLLFTLLLIRLCSEAQTYTSYLTGNSVDTVVNPYGGICLMGGATEDDHAMKWFLQRAAGGDILVLRTTGSNGYNSYLYSGLGVLVNSVETIVCNTAASASDPYVLQKIQQAEGIWFAGGDQWTYVNFWRNTPFSAALDQAIRQRKAVVGGTSAGMAIQGRYYFSAQNGTVTSAQALANPFDNLVTIDSAGFIRHDFLSQTVTDTHFDNPDRKGRLVTFLARMLSDYGVYGKGIACEEYTAVCIDTSGTARVFGGFPAYDDNAYFVQTNCELPNQSPETCSAGNPLTWDRGAQALKVYQIKGDSTGSKSFDLKTWKTGSGGIWLNWKVASGVFGEQNGIAINCAPAGISEEEGAENFRVFPNPSNGYISVLTAKEKVDRILLTDALGNNLPLSVLASGSEWLLDPGSLPAGIYQLILHRQNGEPVAKKVLRW